MYPLNCILILDNLGSCNFVICNFLRSHTETNGLCIIVKMLNSTHCLLFVSLDVRCLVNIIHRCRTFLACITWTEDSVSLIIRPSQNALHLPQQKLLHEDKNRGHFICKPGRGLFLLLYYIVKKNSSHYYHV